MAQGDGAQRFEWSPTNPNDAIGGGGCLCSEQANCDRGGPYKVFADVEMDNPLSPRAVLCNPCAGPYDGEETTQVGEADVLDSTAVEDVEVDLPPVHENPSAEGRYPVLADEDDEIAI